MISKIPKDFKSIVDLRLVIFMSADKLEYPVQDESVRSLIDWRILEHLELCEADLEMNKDIDDYFDEEEFDDFADIDVLLEREMRKSYALEFYNRLQERIDHTQTDREGLIDQKYDMLFNFPLLDADALCTDFKFDNILDISHSEIARNVGVPQALYEIKYLLYLQQIVYGMIDQLVWIEKNEEELEKKRLDFKIEDLHLEVALSYFGFVNLYEFKEEILESLKKKGMKKSLTHILVEENFDEAINYACTHSRKLKTKPAIKVIQPGVITAQSYS